MGEALNQGILMYTYVCMYVHVSVLLTAYKQLLTSNWKVSSTFLVNGVPHRKIHHVPENAISLCIFSTSLNSKH